jgi:hypothetical protein
MEPWPFVIAAYALAFTGTIGTSLWAWRACRSAESRADEMRGRD